MLPSGSMTESASCTWRSSKATTTRWLHCPRSASSYRPSASAAPTGRHRSRGRWSAHTASTADHRTVTAEDILVNPFLFVGTIDEMAEQIIRNRDRYGLTYYTVHEPYLDDFAPVIDRVRILER